MSLVYQGTHFVKTTNLLNDNTNLLLNYFFLN